MNTMTLANEIILRPRFKIEMKQSNEAALQAFEMANEEQLEYIITRSDDHVFIKIPKHKQDFWSPQLHLEIEHLDENQSSLHGFFGPNPTVWTMFMFFHFIVAFLFIGFGIWAYTNYSLNTSYAIQLATMLFLLLIWIGLYIGGRIGKASGKKDMHALYDFMKKTLGID